MWARNPTISDDQLDLIHSLLRRGEKRALIAERAGVCTRTVYRIQVRLGGVPRPAAAEYDSRYLSEDERREIARLHDLGWSVRGIARHLRRAPSTISRELLRNRDPKSGHYLPHRAHTQAWIRQRRPKCSKIAANPRLRAWVRYLLKQRLSPEQIAGRLRVLFPDDESMRISHETIYQSLFVYPRGELTRELKAELRSGRTTRRPRGQRGPRTRGIKDAVSIHERPDEVEGRLIPGHHEGDLIKGSLASNSAVGTIVERHSGFVTLIHLPDGWAADKVAAAVSAEMSQLPKWFAKTLTWDRGSEMARHKDITAATGIDVYFADPYSPQQRPSNENTNGLLREYMPKGTDLSVHTHDDLQAIAKQLNDRPRKRLGFYTPAEVFAKLLADNQTAGVATAP
ncbi:IS30 family transposase [Nocardioides ginkgobilobae]